MKLTKEQWTKIAQALDEGGDECAIETVFEMFPQLSRDEAVDIVLWVDRGVGYANNHCENA